MSTEMISFYRKSRICVQEQGRTLSFLDIEGAFDNTFLELFIQASMRRELDETSCRWINCMLGGRLVYTSILGEKYKLG